MPAREDTLPSFSSSSCCLVDGQKEKGLSAQYDFFSFSLVSEPAREDTLTFSTSFSSSSCCLVNGQKEKGLSCHQDFFSFSLVSEPLSLLALISNYMDRFSRDVKHCLELLERSVLGVGSLPRTCWSPPKPTLYMSRSSELH